VDIYEELVMVYLAKDPLVFLSPQYKVSAGWNCPDFVALDYRHKIVSVVEVSAAFKVAKLAEKVADRKNQWFDKITAQLMSGPHPVIDSSWRPPQVKVFIRKDAEGQFRRVVGSPDDVKVTILEELDFPWGWDWGVDSA